MQFAMKDWFFERLAESAKKRPPCPECGEIYRDQLLTSGAVVALRVTCPHEEQDPDIEQFERHREDWKASQAAAAERFYDAARPPSAFKGASIEGLDDRECSRDGALAAKRYVETWQERKAGGQGFIFSGDIGTGKSLVAAAIANELVKRWERVLFLTVTQFQAKMRDFDSAAETIRDLKSCALLVLDDFGQEKTTEWAASQLFDVVDDRCQNKRPLILTTNLGAKGLESHYIRCLMNGKDRMGADEARVTVGRILSRIRQRCAPVQFIGEDQRANPSHDWLKANA